ncbi:MAG TPA: 50S ribosomal protein L13 [Candidatus Moranbacteria bacterium]|nr:50S ribosomal protein L13 [Candidatus Moranbacteria bacterium]
MEKSKKSKQSIQRSYHLFDAEGKTLGRLATQIATVLRGKNKVDFTPHIDAGDLAVIINSDRIVVTGNKMEGKVYNHFSGFPGGITSITLKDQIKKDSRKVIAAAVTGMLCKNKLRDRMMTRLYIFKDAEHKHKIDITH